MSNLHETTFEWNYTKLAEKSFKLIHARLVRNEFQTEQYLAKLCHENNFKLTGVVILHTVLAV